MTFLFKAITVKGMAESVIKRYISGLKKVETHYPTYCSSGAEERALSLSRTAETGYAFLREFMPSDLNMPLLVLDESDWEKRLQLVYGAFNSDKGCIHFPADKETPFMRFMQPIYDNCPERLKETLESVVGSGPSPFMRGLQQYFDSKVVHELTHPLMENQNIVLGQRWITEFFCDYTNYAFLRRYRDEYKQTLQIQEVMPNIIYEGARPFAEYRRSEDFDNFWAEEPDGLRMLGTPLNLLWFYAKGMRGVIELYDAHGEDFITYVIAAYTPSNKQLVNRLESTRTGLGRWFQKWLKINQ